MKYRKIFVHTRSQGYYISTNNERKNNMITWESKFYYYWFISDLNGFEILYSLKIFKNVISI